MAFLPPGLPAPLNDLIQSNMLSRLVRDGLTSASSYRLDAKRMKLEQGTGQTAVMSRIGMMPVDLRPAPALGATKRATFPVEQFIAAPRPYAESFDVDAPTAYVQVGDYMRQAIQRLGEWAGRTSSRVARGKIFAACAGQTIIRRAQISTDSILLVDSLAGFRNLLVNGIPNPISSVNALPVTIVAATTITGLTVTGVIPVDSDFPDGPGELQLSAALGAAVAANSYVTLANGSPYIIRPNNSVPGTQRPSTEAIVATDVPTLDSLLMMRQKLVDQGVPPHADGTYHLHGDASFLALLTRDTAFRQAFQTRGLGPTFGNAATISDLYRITIIEGNDAPAMGKGFTAQVGGGVQSLNGNIVNYNGTGGAGAPGSSQTMQDNGIPVINSSGVIIRRAIMTGYEVLIESFVDEMEYIRLLGGVMIGKITDNLAAYQIGSNTIVSGNVEGWRLTIRPPVDERMLVSTVTVSNTFDFVAATDANAAADTSDARLFKRAVAMEYGSTW